MEFDLVVNGATVIDGTGQAGFRSNVGVTEGRVRAVATEALRGKVTVEASGRVVAPGFIDLHSHSDWILPLPDHDEILAPLLLQGFTTIVTGNCGFSPAPVTDAAIPLVDHNCQPLRERDFEYRWRGFGEFLSSLETTGVAINTAVLVGHSTLRQVVMGNSSARPSEAEMGEMRKLLSKSLDEGAIGFSTGLAYPPCVFSKNEELLSLLQVTARAKKPFTVHARAYTWVSPFYQPPIIGTSHNIRAVRELLHLAEAAQVKLQLSHLIFVGRHTWRTHGKVLQEIESAADRGVDVALDAFPYTFGNTTIKGIFPDWFLDGLQENLSNPKLLKRLNRELNLLRWFVGIDYENILLLGGFHPEVVPYEGMNFKEIANKRNMCPFETYVWAARLSEGRARVLIGTYSGDEEEETPLRAVLRHPKCAVETDTILTKTGKQNPASFGTAPRFLGKYSRELKLVTLEEAVRKLTSLPAERMGLKEVGKIAVGNWADLVVFDPATVADTTSFARPEGKPEGISSVILSGHVVANEGKMVMQKRHGRVIRGS